MVYQFKKDFKRNYGELDAQTAGEELERIRQAHGGELSPENVIEAARSEDSPLHPVFEWDDSIAAHHFRLVQARKFIRTIVVVYEESDEPQQAFYSVAVQVENESGATKEKRFYQSASVLITKPDQFESAKNLLVRELATSQASLERLFRLAPDRHAQKVRHASRHVEEAHKNLMSITA